jgi:general secretion pathway protein G
MKHIKRFHSGFTIVELLVVIVVIGILATLVTVAYSGISQRATEASLKSDLSQARKEIEVFYAINNTYPTANNCTNTTATQICLKPSSGNILTYTPNNTTSPTSYTLTGSNATSAIPASIRSSAAGSLATHQIGDILLAFACNNSATIPTFSADWTVIASRSSGYSGAIAYKMATSASMALGTIANYKYFNTVSVSGGLRTATTGSNPSFSAGTATGINSGNTINIPTIGSTATAQLQLAHACGVAGGGNPWLIGVALSAGLTQLQTQGWTGGQDILVSMPGTSAGTITSTNYGISSAVMTTIKLTP